MDAMILAAGLGTRLGELTRGTPKALVTVGGMTLLEHVAGRLLDAGADRLIINVHHFAEQIVAHVASRGCFGVEVLFSHEVEGPLETGGGILRAAPLFRRDAPFIIHNVDILSDAPLTEMYERHALAGSLATLAVMDRPTSRRLIFDEKGFCGRIDEGRGIRMMGREPIGRAREIAFCGIHIASPELLDRFTERGRFSILDTYLRLSAAGCGVVPFPIDGYRWMDVGKPEQLRLAEEEWAAADDDRQAD